LMKQGQWVFWEARGKLMQWQASENDWLGRSCVVVMSICIWLWRNESFHSRNQVNIIILTHSYSQTGKKEANCNIKLWCRGANYLAMDTKSVRNNGSTLWIQALSN
jgi:hypothetical protein